MHNPYQDKWESRSSVRTRPRKPIDFNRIGDFFPADKQVLLLLPEIIALGEPIRKKILLQSFYKYLHDIIHLEMQWIYSACNHIIYKKLPIVYSENTKLNAYTVIIDEYYHIYTAYDLITQLHHAFPDVTQLDYAFSDSYNAVVTIKERLDKKYHDVFEIIAVCIFETTLVRELVEYFNHDNLHPSIKYYVNDHMNDEAKHYGFFYDVLCDTWKNLPPIYQKNIGMHLADFVKLYLNIASEKSYNEQLLVWIGQDKENAKIMVDTLYCGFTIAPDIPIVKNVLSVLKKSNILACKYVKHAFQINGLYL